MSRVRKALIIISVILMIGNLTSLNYEDLGWKENQGIYMGLASNILLIIAMVTGIRTENKKSEN